MSGDKLTVKTVKRVRSVRGSALVHITNCTFTHVDILYDVCLKVENVNF